jgi:phosphopantetheine--protein transferase-like protein
LSLGVDIEDIKRFENKSQRFLDRIYTKGEQEYCLSKKLPEKNLAVRFCAKEAVIKALSGLNIEHPPLNQIEIYHNENQVPQIRLLNKSDNKLTFQVSLSHDRTKAIAFVEANIK